MIPRLIASIVTASNHKKCVSLNNQKYMTQPNLIKCVQHDYRNKRIKNINRTCIVQRHVSCECKFYGKTCDSNQTFKC